MAMHEDRKKQLAEFVAWAAKHIKGDEKGEAQIFLDRLFAAFGRKGVKEAGATLEQRIKKADNRGTAFADLVWKPIVLIEMKRRGVDLIRHYRQAFDYWTRLVPGRPRYVVLCNFDEFWVYDFETQMDTPVDRLLLADLPERWGPLAFLFPTDEQPIFGNDHEAVTRKAADNLAVCFNKLVARKVDRAVAQRFTLQMLVALFAEDIGLLDQYTVTRLLEDCQKPGDAYDLLGGLFAAMNTPGVTVGGRYKGVQYFNGGLFAEPAHVELWPDEVAQLRQAARADWSQVRPEIFGVLFEHSMDQEERHAFGAHFTSPVDIMKIVGPTIVEPWREQIESAKTMGRLNELLHRMHNFTVLDPACGSGNFLYIAYRELKRLEARIIERLTELSKKLAAKQRVIGFVTAANFFGMDINPFAIELAKVTMMIARKLAIDELHISEHALPLDNLDANFFACDALIGANGTPTPWPKVDVIIGNPPFLGAKRLKPERGADYVNAIRKAYPEVPGMADYCVYWLRRAHDHLQPCTQEDTLTGRGGLVGTQNIRNNQSRVGGLDHIVHDGTVVEAVDNQPWSGEANVHVAIANWVKTHDKAVLPAKRRLWHRVDPSLALTEGTAKSRGRRAMEPPGKRHRGKNGKSYELAFRDCAFINSSLSDKTDVSEAAVLNCNTTPQRCFTGQMVGHDGFLLTREQLFDLLRKSKDIRKITFPHLNGREFLTGSGLPNRFVLDFGQRNQLEAAAYAAAYEWVQQRVLPDRMQKSREGIDNLGKVRPHHKQFLARWWQLSFPRPELIAQIEQLKRYIVCSRVTKRPVFVFVSPRVRPGDALSCFTFQDDYSFGVLQSAPHWQWFLFKCSKLTERLRYSPESVFDTFPWPQSATTAQIDAVSSAGREIRRVRTVALGGVQGGLRALYRTLELPGKNPLKDAHAALDAAVLLAYGFSAKRDLLSQLLDLNRNVAARIDAGEPVVAPGIPSAYPDRTRLVSDDCIRAD
jgi:SAM-dependent methyltransferase